VVLAVLALLPSSARAQEGSAYRFGIALGGVSTVGLIVEREWEWGTVELTVGTWGFRDVSVSLVHKQYIGGGEIQGAVGAGLWGVLAFPPGEDERTGAALAVRMPVGVQWAITPEHAVTAEVGLNRALSVRRTDPEDRLPLNKRIVPLPGFSYRWRTAS
jgi:hypothetical protein